MKSLLLRFTSFLVLGFLISKSLTLSSCANIIPPSGGPRDSLPPRLLKVTPPDSSKGFDARTITFSFDEYVELQDVFKNVLVTPTPENNPEIESKLRTVTVKLEDTLEPNTTYMINFGNAIQDINERNPLKNFTYIFTTGTYFDSLEFRGNVVLAETGGIDTSMIVMLHRTGEDSAVVNKKPRYITRVDGQGNFRFRYLPAGTYFAYALKDENGLGKYFSSEQLFGFAEDPVIVTDTTPAITIHAWAVKKPPETPVSAPRTNRPAANEVARLRFSSSTTNGQQDLLQEYYLQFNNPLKDFSPEGLKLSTDTSFSPVKDYAWELDSTRTRATLKIKWQEDTRYNLVLEKEFAKDSLDLQLLKSDTLQFRTKRLDEYGSVRIRYAGTDTARHPVLLIQQGAKIVQSASLAKGEFFTPLFLPGNYELAILYDTNQNGVWDPGEFFGKRIQPEIVKPLKDKLVVRASWDNEVDIR